jgi:hypothetical protein
MIREMLTVVVLATLLCGPAAQAQAPVPAALKEAKTVFFVNESGSQDTFDQLAKRFQKWGRFTLVDAAEKSDITLTLEASSFRHGWPVRITKTGTATALWSDNMNTGWNMRIDYDKVVEHLRKQLQSK